MSAITTIIGLMPLIQSAAQVVTSFNGNDDERARNDENLKKAFEVIAAVSPLVETFMNGGNVTERDVHVALQDFDEELEKFEEEVRLRDQSQTGG